MDENVPYFFLVDHERYAIGTSKGIASSEKSIDISLESLANNYELQVKLNLLSAVLLKPAWNPPITYPMEGEELLKHTAFYLSSFTSDQKEQDRRNNYLLNDGHIRILITDDKLLEEVKQVI